MRESHVRERAAVVRVHAAPSEGHRFRSRRDHGSRREGRQGSARSASQASIARAQGSDGARTTTIRARLAIRRYGSSAAGRARAKNAKCRPRLEVAVPISSFAGLRGERDRETQASPYSRFSDPACSIGGRTIEPYREARDMPLAASLFRNALVGKRFRYSNDPGASGAYQSSNDDDLYPRVEPRRTGCPKPSGSSMMVASTMTAAELCFLSLSFVFSGSRVVPRTVISRSPCRISFPSNCLPRLTESTTESYLVAVSPTNCYLACGLQLCHFSAV